MTQIFHLPEDIRGEFSIDYSGKAYASRSAIARLCGVRQQSINELLEKIATGKPVSESLSSFTGNNYRGTGKIPDVVYLPYKINNKQQQQWFIFFTLSKITITQ